MAQELPPRRYPEMNGKIALVTGGSTGIGLATARAFAREGATVIIASRNEKRAKQALTTLTDDGLGSWTQCDVTDSRDVDRLISSILKEHRQIDYAFNNAWEAEGKCLPVASMSEEAWGRRSMAILHPSSSACAISCPPCSKPGAVSSSIIHRSMGCEVIRFQAGRHIPLPSTACWA